MKIKIYVVSTCIPEPGERPCFPNVFTKLEDAEAHADKMLREEWVNNGPCDEDSGELLPYPDDWREANDAIAAHIEDGSWGEWELTEHEIDLPIAGDMLAFAQQMAHFTTPEDEFADDPQDYADVEEMISEMGDERLCGEYSTFMEMVRSARALVAKAEGR